MGNILVPTHHNSLAVSNTPDPGDRGPDAARKVTIFSLQVLMRFIGTKRRRNINTWDEDGPRVSKVSVQSHLVSQPR